MKERTEIIAGYYGAARNELVEFVGRRTGNRALAEDMVHDAFMRLLTTDNLLTETTLLALTYTIVRNLMADYFRRKAYAAGYEQYISHAGACADDTAGLCSRHEVEA